MTHKLSERVAIISESTLERRVQVCQLVRKAYGLRSKVVHGAPLSLTNVEEVHDVLKELDDVLRKIITQAFSDNNLMDLLSASNDDIDEYFSRITLSGGL